MIRIPFVLLMIFLSYAMVGCGAGGGNSTSAVTPPKVAKLEFSSPNIAGSSKALAAYLPTTRDVPADFELGNVETTSTFLFLLKNTGTADLTNVQIACSDPSVICTPNTIATLSPEATGGLTPVIQVKVVHGVSASGLTGAPLLPTGRWFSTLSAQGVTAGTNAPVSATATLGANVEVAQFQFLDGTKAEDLTASGAYNGFPSAPYPWSTYSDLGATGLPTWVTDSFTTVPLVQGDVTLVNTGNAPLTVQEFGATYAPDGTVIGFNWFTPTQVVVVQPGETLAPAPTAPFPSNYPGNWYAPDGTLIGSSATQATNWVMLRVTSPAQMDPSYYQVAPGAWQGVIRHNGPGTPTGNG